MAGLLDFFGNGWDDPKSNAVMALAGGLLDGDFAGGMKGYAQTMAGAGDAKMKRAMQEAQMAKYASDVEMDKQKLTLDQAKAKRAGEMESLLMGMFKGGAVEPQLAAPNMSVTGMPPSGSPTGVQGRADPFAGVDRTALMLDYMQNGGKNMGEWVNKRTAPDMAVTDGYAYDKNKLGAGFMPFLRTDASGKTSMGQIGANGLPMVSAPQGALETFNAYRNADETVKNRNTLSTITMPDGTTRMVTNDALLGRATQSQPTSQRPAAAGSEAQIIANGMGGLNGLPTTARGGNVSFKSTPQEMDKPRILQDAFQTATQQLANAQKLGDVAGMNRAQSDMQAIQRELGGRAPSLAPNTAPQSAPSFGLELQSESQKQRTAAENRAYETKLVEQTKADIQPTQARQANISAAENAISLVDKALNHKGLGVATGLSGVIDPRNYVAGQVGKDYKAVQSQLEGKAFLSAFEQLKGGGAISEKEGEKAQQAIARMSLSQSESEYRQGLKDYKEVLQTGLSRMKGDSPKQEQKAQALLDALPAANTSNKGQRIRDTTTGKILKSNGMSWVAE
jgi:hypothetical protein